jgi:hypothetical protein
MLLRLIPEINCFILCKKLHTFYCCGVKEGGLNSMVTLVQSQSDVSACRSLCIINVLLSLFSCAQDEILILLHSTEVQVLLKYSQFQNKIKILRGTLTRLCCAVTKKINPDTRT